MIRNLWNKLTGSDIRNSGTAMSWSDLFAKVGREKRYSGYDETKIGLSALYCGLQMYTSQISTLPRNVQRLDDGGNPTRNVSVAEHPAAKIFLHSADTEWLADDMLSTIAFDLLYYGNFYAVRVENSKGQTYRLNYIHPTRIPKGAISLASGDEKYSLGYGRAKRGDLIYKINTGDSATDKENRHLLLPKSALVHLKGSMVNKKYHCGEGFYDNAGVSLDMYSASEAFGRDFYTRGVSTQMFLSTDKRLAPEIKAQMEQDFNDNRYKEFEDMFKTRILENNLKPVHVGLPMQHIQFIETRAFSIEDVGRWLSIPPALLHSRMGTAGGGGGEDVEKATTQWIQFGIGPLLTRIGQQLRDELVAAPYRPWYNFNFEQLYLFRSVPNQFAQAIRNLYEISVLDRRQVARLLSMGLDNNDPTNTQRYVPTNLMTVEHSIKLAEKAGKALDVMDKQIEKMDLDNKRLEDSPMPSQVYEDTKAAGPEEGGSDDEEKSPQTPGTKEGDKDESDTSPDEHNRDKKLRNVVETSWNAVLGGLQQYEQKVLNQKKESRPDDYDAAVDEFYAKDGRFAKLLNDSLSPWDSIMNEVSGHDTAESLITLWLDNKGLDL
jgi:HK97 family phage portal protein